MGSLTDNYPKALIHVDNGTPLIGFPISAMSSAGIKKILIVVGYLGDRLKQELGDGSRFGVELEYISNEEYLGGNAVSVHKAMDWAGGKPVVLCMADHLIEQDVVKLLLDNQVNNETLCVDSNPAAHHEVDEATKVAINNLGHIREIGKNITEWDALDTGVFLLTRKFFSALDELIHNNGYETEISDVIRFLISRGHRFDTCNIDGCFWMDVDTQEDLKVARGI